VSLFDTAYMVDEILFLLEMDWAYYVLVLIVTIEWWIRHVMCCFSYLSSNSCYDGLCYPLLSLLYVHGFLTVTPTP
jgi:hypothetical protein